MIMSELPYIIKEKIIIKKIYKYNPKYGDDRICICGDTYYRQIELNVLDKINTMRNDARYIRNKQILNEHNISASDYELYVISKKMELTPDILRELIHE